MNIYGTQFVHGAHSLSGPHSAKSQQAAGAQQTAPTQAKDEVTLSNAAQQASQTSENTPSSGEVRFDLVNRLRSEITAGTYETPEKLESAIEKMLVSLAR